MKKLCVTSLNFSSRKSVHRYMCGFVGAFGRAHQVDDLALQQAADVIAHRGPDAEGYHFSPGGDFAVGHRRLAILGLNEFANQPMELDRRVFAYNGELYNYQELQKNYDFENRSESDTEVFLRGLNQEGLSFLNQCEGMFAGAWYEPEDRSLYLFRDSLGIKPLYYRFSRQTCYFASEIKALLVLTPEQIRGRKSVIECYMRYENFPQKESLYAEVISLRPGEVVRFGLQNDGSLSCKSSFMNPPSFEYDHKGDTKEAGRTALRKAVKQHLVSDVPLGVYLSGGTDSSLVACLAAEHNSNLLGFTGYFEEQGDYYDERPLSQAVAKHIDIPIIEVAITPEHFIDTFDSLIWHLDEPRMGMGAFSQYMVAQVAAKSRKVVLAGHGGDELFAGYPMFKAHYVNDSMSSVGQALAGIRALRSKDYVWAGYFFYQKWLKRRVAFAPDIFGDIEVNDELDSFFAKRKSQAQTLNLLNEYYRRVYLPGLLMVEDRISMAHSLETRVPLWSEALRAFAYSIPIEEKLAKGRLKAFLKDTIRGIVPDSILDAPKRGFPTPLRNWFRTSLRTYVEDRLLGNASLLGAFIERREIERLVRSHMSVPAPFAWDERRAHRIWMLLCLESWIRQYQVGEMVDA